jgi:ribosomal protein S7
VRVCRVSRKAISPSDQADAEITPSETRVSIDVVPWRRFSTAVRWNGHAAQPTTGSASATTTHCQ